MPADLRNAVAAWLESRSEDAARTLVEGLYSQIIAIVRRHLPFRMDEDDLAQEVFAKLFAGLHRYDGAGRWKTGLHVWRSMSAATTCAAGRAARNCDGQT